MTELTKYALSDLYDIASGISSTKEQAGHGTPFLSFSTVFNNYFLPSELPDLMETSSKEQEIFSIKEGDVFFTRTSENVDELAMSSVALKEYPCATFSGFLKRLRPKMEDLVYPKFMAFYFRSSYFRKLIDCNTIMTLRASFNEDIFSFLNVYLPNYSVQKKIGDFLYHLEVKIQLNSRINDNLMQMASTAFMHYFFERTPNGKLGSIIIEHPKSNIQVGEAQNSSGNVPFFTSGDSILKWDTVLVDDRCCYLNTGGNADVKFYVGKAAYSTDTWCISGTDQLSDYLYLFLYAIKPELDKKLFQGTGLKHLQKPLLKDRPIYIPTTQELNVFNAQIMPMMTKISENTRENQRLMSIRDWLLPLLMNGQATVEA